MSSIGTQWFETAQARLLTMTSQNKFHIYLSFIKLIFAFIFRSFGSHGTATNAKLLLMALLKPVLGGTHPMRRFTLASLAATALTLGLLTASPSMAQTSQH